MSKKPKAAQETTKQQSKQPVLPSSFSVELNKPVAVTMQGEAKAQVKNSWDWRDYTRLVTELIGLIVLVCYAITTQKLWIESHEQSGHIKTQLELSQRAVLVVGDPSQKFNARQVKFPVINTGFAAGTVRSIKVDYGVAGGSKPVSFHGINMIPDIERISHETRTYSFKSSPK